MSDPSPQPPGAQPPPQPPGAQPLPQPPGAMPPEEVNLAADTAAGGDAIPPEIQEALDQVTPESGVAEPKAEPEPVLGEKRVDTNNPTLDRGSYVGDAVSRVVDKMDDKIKGNKDGPVPKEMAPRWELIVREARNAIKQKRDDIKKVIGDRPYQGFPLDKEEAKTRYLQMREDVELQTTALEANIQKSKEGRLLVNKEYLKAMMDFEEGIRKGEMI